MLYEIKNIQNLNLQLNNYWFYEEDIKIISQNLLENTELQYLNFSLNCNNICKIGAKYLSDFL